jgi:hypothetical protein
MLTQRVGEEGEREGEIGPACSLRRPDEAMNRKGLLTVHAEEGLSTYNFLPRQGTTRHN